MNKFSISINNESSFFNQLEEKRKRLSILREKSLKKGQILHLKEEDIEKQVYLYLKQKAKTEELPLWTLKWMKIFVEKTSHDILRENVHKEIWVHQFRHKNKEL